MQDNYLTWVGQSHCWSNPGSELESHFPSPGLPIGCQRNGTERRNYFV